MWSDPSSTNMAYGNQWMNPALYKNMTNEQVDWASLAQQWIKMKETPPPMLPGQQNRIPTSEHALPSHRVELQNTSNTVPGTNTTLNNHSIVSPVIRNNIEKPSAWNTWTYQQQQQWNWNWASSSSALSAKPPMIESINSLRPPFIVPPILSEPPPPYPMMTPNKSFTPNNYWVGPNTRVPPPTEPDQWNKLNIVPNVDDRTQDPSFIDAAKRKQLPAWIREGLEKMEKEKRRKIEQEQSISESDYSSFSNENVTQELPNSPMNMDHETQMVDDDIEPASFDYINENEPRKTEFVKNDLSPLIPRKTKAQIWEDTMLSLRKILTKLLMDVTNEMMLNVVKDVLKNTLQTDNQVNQNQTSLAGKLGLGVYGSESGSSDESDEEQHASGHKQLKHDSDEAIQERILKRQREFSYIEAKILIELDQLEDREKLVRSKFDNSIKFNGETNDNSSLTVENIQKKGRTEDDESSDKMVKGHDKVKKESSNDLNIKNGHKKKKSKSKRSSSSSSSRSSVSKKSNNTDYKNKNKKSDKTKSKSSIKTNADSVKRKRRSRSRNRSRSYSISKSSKSHPRYRSRSRSKHYDRRSPHNYRSRRSRSPPSHHSYSRKHKSKRTSSSSSDESRSKKHRYKR
ncbi:arginine/serine-rich protein PNISR-like [Melanaphis sacchari]|uniref:arginine/serine-rich protein PNISR-like n=1 Tax=Melanaphis sacchari TaxID=742174 RepID=UPI000DC156F4|nr:arginine/serine-rich protein PNISR-like [Melanaphis sacchari]